MYPIGRSPILLHYFPSLVKPCGFNFKVYKNRILTSTTGASILEELAHVDPILAEEVSTMIDEFSVQKVSSTWHSPTRSSSPLASGSSEPLLGHPPLHWSFSTNNLQRSQQMYQHSIMRSPPFKPGYASSPSAPSKSCHISLALTSCITSRMTF